MGISFSGPHFAVPFALVLLTCVLSAKPVDSHSITRTGINSDPAINSTSETPPTLSTDPPSSQGQNSVAITGLSIAFAFLGAFSICSVVVILRRIKRLKNMFIGRELDKFLSRWESSPNLIGIGEQPFNTDFEIKPENLVIDHDTILGTGQFSKVCRGVLKRRTETIEGEDQNENEKEELAVAVTILNSDVPINIFKECLSDVKLLCRLGSHENIVLFFGAVTANIRNREISYVLELCPNGDLLTLIRKIKPNFKNLFTPANSVSTNQPTAMETEATPSHLEAPETERADGVPNENQEVHTNPDTSNPNPNQFSTMNLLEWSRQISSGMAYVSSKNIIHRDMAARNILLTSNNVAKITEFGISRHLRNYSTYVQKTPTPLPWRWLALESLNEMEFSVASDVWAYGVVLYELFSLGATPYPGFSWTHSFVDQLTEGYRLEAPEWSNDDIYQLMMDCMKKEPSERPSFEEITRKLEKIKIKIHQAEDSDSDFTEAELNLDK